MNELIANQEAIVVQLQERFKDSINSLPPEELSHLASAITLASQTLVYLIGNSLKDK